MKVSKKEYRDKQNQATGALLMSILAFIMILFHSYQVFVNDQPFEWERLLGWIILFPGMFIVWKRREDELRSTNIDE